MTKTHTVREWLEQRYATVPFSEPVTTPAYGLTAPTKSPLADLLDPTEGWTQEGFVWWNRHGDSIRPCRNRDRPDWLDVCIVQDTKAILGEFHTAPTILSAMAMVNQYRREQWQ